MLKGLAKQLFGFGSGKQAPPLPLPPDMDHAAESLDPGAPYAHGEPVPRWPEFGAAMVAATPEQLVETQKDLIRQIKQFSPLTPAQFDQLIIPVFHRYAAWVHLLPASEDYHHYGPGGLLNHGFEVALHAARIAEGRQVGKDMTPSEAHKYKPRWRIATMLAGLFHDLGKPLVDCGATCVNSRLTWPSMDVSLYEWLKANNLTHYRFHWRGGARHERHKAVGTAVVREIIGPELLAWLADEPRQEVTALLMTSIAQGKVAGDLMSTVVSNADSMSVEADRQRLAAKEQATGRGGQKSIATLVMAELRKLLENNKLDVNKPGAKLWHTTAGTFGVLPYVLDEAHSELARRQAPGLPAMKMDIVQVLADTGFIEICKDEETKNTSLTWHLTVDIVHKDQVQTSPELRVIKFSGTEFLFGNLPLPRELQAICKAPFMTAEDVRATVASVQIADEPQSVESALGQAVEASAKSSTGETPAAEPVNATVEPEQVKSAEEDEAPTYAEDRRNRRDHASSRSVEDARRREREGQAEDSAALLAKLEAAGFAGTPMAEVIRRIAARKLVWGADAFENSDGLIVRYPMGLERLGIPPADLLPLLGAAKWLVTDAGSDRQVTERKFPNGQQCKCIVLTGLVFRTWERVRDEHMEILEGKAVDLHGDDSLGEAPAPKPAEARSTAPAAGGAQGPGQNRRDESRQPPQKPVQNGQRAPTSASGNRQQPTQQPASAKPQPAQQQRQSGQKPAPPTSSQGAPSAPPRPAAEKPEKPMRPAVGAAPAPGRDLNSVGTEMSFGADSAEKPTAPPLSKDMRPPAHERRDYPRGMEDLKCTKLDDITPQKAEWINGIVMRMIGIRLHQLGLDVNDPAQPDAATIKTLLTSFLQKNEVIRPAPFVTALAFGDNPLFLFKKPDSLRLEDVGTDIRRNPEYKAPEWVFHPPGRATSLLATKPSAEQAQ